MSKSTGVILIVIGLILIVGSLSYVYGQDEDVISKTDKFKVSCDVTLQNDLFIGNTKIDNFLCEVKEKCSFFSGFSILKDTGNLLLEMDDGITDSTSFSVFEGTSKTYTIDLCTTSKSGELKVLGDRQEVWDSVKFTAIGSVN